MTVAAGEVVYRLGETPCSGAGLRWLDDELTTAMYGQVATVLFDDKGKADIEEILAGLAETEFARDGLSHVLKDPVAVEDWRVGEAIAEAYLTDHRSCCFPWPDARDERKGGSSLPGADLVGFRTDESGDCFAFGEVKTSSDHSHPPGAMYGRTGLKRQLEDLCDSKSIRDDLVKYLGHRARSAQWRAQFKRAAARYLLNASDIQLYGCLVRDVEPHRNDLRARVSDLGAARPEATRIELLAIYLPQECLGGIGEKIITQRTGVEP